MKRTLLVMVAILATGISVLAASAEINWISQLPGVAVLTSSTDDKETQIVYSVSGDPDSFWATFRDNLQRHHWSVESGANVNSTAGEVYAVVASHNGHALHAVLGRSLPVTGQTLSVQYKEHGSFKASDENTAVSIDGGSATVVGDTLDLVNNNEVRTLRCHHSTLNILGNTNSAECYGTCRVVNLTGNNNRITFHGQIETINMLGNNNVVKWSRTSNATPPAIQTMGNHNVVSQF